MTEIDIGSIVLSPQEICELTRYKVPAYQMRVLAELGIRAKLLRDNTVRVLRRDLLPAPVAANIAAATRPKLKF